VNPDQFEEMLRKGMGQAFGNQQQSLLSTISQERLYELVDEFIQKCYDVKGYHKNSLMNDIQLHLQGSPVLSLVELEVLPVVMRRLQEKY